MTTAIQKLQELYDSLPEIACQGKCWNSCGVIDMSNLERSRIQFLGVTIPLFTEERAQRWANDEPLHCPALDRQTLRCNVYAVRPMVCRLWGVADSMPCEHGCKPTRVLTDEETYEYLFKSMEIGGHYAHKGAEYQQFLEILRDPEIGPLMSRFIRGEREVMDELARLIEEKRPF